MQTDTDSIFNLSICKTDSNVHSDQENRDGKLSTSLQTINSFLSMDDTILRSIEDDINDVHPASPDGKNKSAKIQPNEWSNCNTNEEHDIFEEEDEILYHKKLEEELQNEIDERIRSSTSCDTSVEEETRWQDNTFLNNAFTQLNAIDDRHDNSKDSNQINLINDFDISDEEQNCFDSFVLKQSSENTNKDASKPLNLLKRNSPETKTTVPNKKSCVTDQKTSRSNFYGLPESVKKLILQAKGISTLYQWQDECLNLEAVKNRRNLIYALPTSGGKTLVAEILMLKEVICNKKNAIFILPFVAIVQEKVQSLAPFALELGFLVEEYAAAKGTYPPKKRRAKNTVYICTIEKALGLINSLIEEKRLNEIGIIVVDELHLLGESGGRGATLEGLLTKVLYVNANVHIVGMSATIGNLNEIAQFLDAELYTGQFRPIEIKEYVKCGDDIWLLDLKSEELLTDLKKINYRYSPEAATMDPDRIGGLVMDVVPQDSCLIFCSSRKNCENVALLLSRILFKSLEAWKKEEKQKLLNALKTEEGLCPTLSKTIKFGVAYHHSGLTSEERRLLEDAFRAGTLCVICCTSTLAAGVNLPARRVILRSPYVGNQFLNLSRYKQMIGRAGRAGMGHIGESILVCKNNDLPKVQVLLRSKMDDSLSTMHIEKDRGINNLILSSVLLCIATTRSELQKVVAKTLLSIQQKHLNIDIKKVVDDTISTFIKGGVMNVKKNKNNDALHSNISIIIPSQNVDPTKICVEKKGKKTILLRSDTQLELCNLGRAAMKGCIDMQCAHILYQDLKLAQKHLILIDYLHLLYLVTPYDIVSQVKPVGSVYYETVMSLSENQMETARLLGVNEATATKLRDGLMPRGVEPRVVQRFYVTLILHELWNHHAVYTIAEKYQVSRGIIQNLLTAVSSFAGSVVRFCEELDEFWAFRDLLSSFSKKLSYCCPMELEALMELPLVKIGRARQMYNAGYRTVQSVATANPADLQDKIPYLSKNIVIRIIEAAKLLILERVENLKDEAEDVLDGIDIDNLGKSAFC